ncbi:MAG: Ig-like domain repeat protein [Acidimicrobiales bacterium]
MSSSSRLLRWPRLGAAAAATVVAAGLVVVLAITSAHALPPGSPATFSLTGSVTGLAPGVGSSLVLNAANPNSVPITVTSLTISDSTPPVNCPLTNLTINGSAFSSGSVIVNGLSQLVAKNASANIALPILLAATAPNGCQVTTFTFTYAGSATYIEPILTALSSAPNPSTLGQSVQFTATVSGNILPASAAVTPVGSATFFECTVPAGLATGSPASSCTTAVVLSSAVALSATGVANFSTTTLTAGTHAVFAVFTATDPTSFAASSSTILDQVVTSTSIGTSTALTSAPNPSAITQPVTLTATVTKASGAATLTGSVKFYLGTPGGSHTLLATVPLKPNATAALVTATLPPGSDSLYAVYSGDATFAASTSPVIAQLVVAPPALCTGSYANDVVGNPALPIANGTNGNDFIYAVGASFIINGFQGSDCLQAGNGNDVITDGNGSDTVLAGNGNNVIALGNGNDVVVVGAGSNVIGVGNGNDTVTLGAGSWNVVLLGNGADVVSVQGGSHDLITGGNASETIYLGAGTYNTYLGGAHHPNTCHLPKPPSSWHGTTAAYYHDTITNCTVVSP